MERNQFTFYISFFKTIQRIRGKQARADAYDAICAYAFHETMPDLDALPPAAAIAFEAAQPVLDAGRRRAMSGASGGSAKPRGTRSNAKQAASEIEEEKEEEKEKENECSPPSPPPRGRGRKRRQNVPCGSAGSAPLGEVEEEALARMLGEVKHNA